MKSTLSAFKNCVECLPINKKEALPAPSLPKPPTNDTNLDCLAEKNVLLIQSIDQCIQENGLDHRTDKYFHMYHDSQLVVRRGQPFKLVLKTNRAYSEADKISFIFTVADEKVITGGHDTLVAIPLLSKTEEDGKWSARILEAGETFIAVSITPSVDCIVAEWKMDIDTKLENNGAVCYSHEKGIFILFNPWNKLDQVYMESEEWRDECVLQDTGLIWRGSYNRLRPCPWKYAQFEKDILECSLLLVKIGKVTGKGRSDPVKITRALSAAVNSPDDNGCLEGNWGDNFEKGTPPTSWIGSMEILQKYFSKRTPVKYGQCWVFAGVLATVCRAIGIPCRPVTNFSSAHDTNCSLTIDCFVDDNGKVMEDLNSDSVWNFHVWDEAWMRRPDLGAEYDGWQAIDATPQEQSDNMYRCGPASLVAIRKGEILKPYDCDFLLAEVNADKVFWRYNGSSQPLKLLGKDIQSIGQFISTKAAGRWEREDITTLYKPEEGSRFERSVLQNALEQAENQFSRYYLNEDFNDIRFNFELKDDIVIGQSFDVTLSMTNKNPSKDFNVNVILLVNCVSYTGRTKIPVKRDEFIKKLKASSTDYVKLTVSYEEYSRKLLDQCSFQMACLATVEGTKYEYFAQDDFRVRKPDIKIKLLDVPVKNREVQAEVILQNPLPVTLKKGKFCVELTGYNRKMELKVGKFVEAGVNACSRFTFVPEKEGSNTIAAKFTSKELDDVDGYLDFTVVPKC